MKVLLVTPVEGGSGETITALHIAEELVAQQHDILFLASDFARYFVEKRFRHHIRQLREDGKYNRLLWQNTLKDYQPDIVIFADYPLLFFRNGVASIANDEWVKSLADVTIPLVTLDHFGFGQQETGMFFGPPHLSFHYEHFPATPEFMHILLPCPMHDPAPERPRQGIPFRYWDVPINVLEEKRLWIRQRYLSHEDDYLVFHSVPKWAWQMAQSYDLPYYEYLPQILDYYLGDLPKPVTIVSVNNGDLLKQPDDSRIRFVNASHLPKADYEALIFSADLMLTENKMSISMGKAVCGYVPCAVLQNSFRYRQLRRQDDGPILKLVNEMEMKRPGAIFPYHVFPSGRDEFEKIGLYKGSSFQNCFVELEIYGAETTKVAFQRVFTEEEARADLRMHQEAYVQKLQQTPGPVDVLSRIVKGEGIPA